MVLVSKIMSSKSPTLFKYACFDMSLHINLVDHWMVVTCLEKKNKYSNIFHSETSKKFLTFSWQKKEAIRIAFVFTSILYTCFLRTPSRTKHFRGPSGTLVSFLVLKALRNLILGFMRLLLKELEILLLRKLCTLEIAFARITCQQRVWGCMHCL